MSGGWKTSRYNPFANKSILKFAIDLAIWTLAIPIAFILRLDWQALEVIDSMLILAAIGIPLHLFLAYFLGYHRQAWTKIGLHDVRSLVIGTTVAVVPLFFAAWAIQSTIPMPRSVPVITGGVALLGFCGVRFVTRGWYAKRSEAGDIRVLIVDADDDGTRLAKELGNHTRSPYTPIGFIDEDESKHGTTYDGIPVHGSQKDLPDIATRVKPDELWYTTTGEQPAYRREIFRTAEQLGIRPRAVPDVLDIVGDDAATNVNQVIDSFISKEKPQDILVIGGAGYIGSALISRLLEAGYSVRVLDKLVYGREPIAEFLDHPRFELIEGDFRQINYVVDAVQGMDAVVHLGAIVGDPASALDEEITVEVNLMATKMVAEVVKGYGIPRFIFASTCSVYGESDATNRVTESDSLNPVSLYAETKIESEQVLLEMADERFNPTILRFGTVYGFSGRTRFDLVVNLLTAKAIQDGEITLYGGDQWRPFVHVYDVAKALEMVLDAPIDAIDAEIFNVGSEAQNYRIREIAEIIQQNVPAADIVQVTEEHDGRNYRADFSKIERVIGFEPDWTLDDGIEQIIEEMESDSVQDYTDPTYSNIKFLTEQGVEQVVQAEFEDLFDVIPNQMTSEQTMEE